MLSKRRISFIVLTAALTLAAAGSACAPAGNGKNGAGSPLAVSSPDGSLAIAVSLAAKPQPYLPGERLYYRVTYKGAPVLADSPLGLDLAGGPALDHGLEVVSTDRRSNDATWENAFGARRTVPDRYNELAIRLREKNPPHRLLDVVLRAYDEGVAFRYILPKQEALSDVAIAAETTGFYFAGTASAFAQNLGRWDTSNEGEYLRTPLADIKPASLVHVPLLVEMPEAGLWAALLKADLTDYAGMYVGGVAGVPNALTARLAVAPRRRLDRPVVGATPLTTPWRVLMVGPDPARFIEHNYLVLDLSAPCALADTSWIKPGKAAWDWWSGSYATGVPFKPGMNTATMKHYIDFAARHKLEYMLVDAGWAPLSQDGRIEDILRFRPEVDVPAIIAYGRSKGVATLLWVEWQALDRVMDEALALFEKWGAAGIKVDYMNRDDQDMVNYYQKVVKKAAEHRLTVDFHGAYKPTGLRRAYPNLLTREGVMGLEYSKWSDRITPTHDVTIPFTRMLAGPMDFTPGAMRNAARGKFEARDVAPMAQGTRAHQLAMYVVYESPLVMVSDYPEACEGQPGLEFIEKVPVVWDDTKVLAGKPAKFVAIARRSGDGWWIGAMADWDGRALDLPLDFLGAGAYEATVFADGPGAAEDGTSLDVSRRTVGAGDRLALRLAPGGGAAVMLMPVK
ncbi:MAG TPA: glycoside hydrolase family 97 protein [Candidatus Aminicenantes bacterium]|nr:glycoside hydrolase family 97 protein [Candidatus Aminicenantes bacterium]HRY65589.1 glycoside hydrolase family 97 protein [Candidatus Aminicenantes bacterium]HRZ72523.1 glycoside hydrolase family 97 protein [Candidatus Aminicenantes bacterium]